MSSYYSYMVSICTVLYCTVLYCTVLYCTVLYCTVGERGCAAGGGPGHRRAGAEGVAGVRDQAGARLHAQGDEEERHQALQPHEDQR